MKDNLREILFSVRNEFENELDNIDNLLDKNDKIANKQLDFAFKLLDMFIDKVNLLYDNIDLDSVLDDKYNEIILDIGYILELLELDNNIISYKNFIENKLDNNEIAQTDLDYALLSLIATIIGK